MTGFMPKCSEYNKFGTLHMIVKLFSFYLHLLLPIKYVLLNRVVYLAQSLVK